MITPLSQGLVYNTSLVSMHPLAAYLHNYVAGSLVIVGWVTRVCISRGRADRVWHILVVTASSLFMWFASVEVDTWEQLIGGGGGLRYNIIVHYNRWSNGIWPFEKTGCRLMKIHLSRHHDQYHTFLRLFTEYVINLNLLEAFNSTGSLVCRLYLSSR